jgi:hypothetical protein
VLEARELRAIRFVFLTERDTADESSSPDCAPATAIGWHSCAVMETPQSGGGSRRRWFPAVAAALLLVLGYPVGLRSPWNAHDPYLVDGEATRNGRDSSALVQGDSGTQLWFDMHDIVWKSGDRTGADGIPPCLRGPEAQAQVQVGVVEVSRPFGSGSYRKVLSVTCL